MKKYIILTALIFTGIAFAQENDPKLEAVGELVKTTYYFENGKIQQKPAAKLCRRLPCPFFYEIDDFIIMHDCRKRKGGMARLQQAGFRGERGRGFTAGYGRLSAAGCVEGL